MRPLGQVVDELVGLAGCDREVAELALRRCNFDVHAAFERLLSTGAACVGDGSAGGSDSDEEHEVARAGAGAGAGLCPCSLHVALNASECNSYPHTPVQQAGISRYRPCNQSSTPCLCVNSRPGNSMQGEAGAVNRGSSWHCSSTQLLVPQAVEAHRSRVQGAVGGSYELMLGWRRVAFWIGGIRERGACFSTATCACVVPGGDCFLECAGPRCALHRGPGTVLQHRLSGMRHAAGLCGSQAQCVQRRDVPGAYAAEARSIPILYLYMYVCIQFLSGFRVCAQLPTPPPHTHTHGFILRGV
jgi:hypothetical protein